jgi:hypothetical protein
VTEPALPVTEPAIALVTVRSTKVPTEVKLEFTTLEARVVPVNAAAGACKPD